MGELVLWGMRTNPDRARWKMPEVRKDGAVGMNDKGVNAPNPNDNVNHPAHYADKLIEVIDYIRDTLTPDGFVDYCIGNVIKYVSRWRKKGGVEDLEKADVYLKWAIERAVNRDD